MPEKRVVVRQRTIVRQKNLNEKDKENQSNSEKRAIDIITNICAAISSVSVRVMRRVTNPTPTITSLEIKSVTRTILRDYIYRKLEAHNCLTARIRLKLPHSGEELCNIVITAGTILEKHYPKVYMNVSKTMTMTMSSPAVVKGALLTVLEELFRFDINWGKILSMLAITSTFALECVQQGHGDFLDDLIDCIVSFISINLADWLKVQGGWVGFKRKYGQRRKTSTDMIYLGGIIILLFLIIILTVVIVILLKY